MKQNNKIVQESQFDFRKQGVGKIDNDIDNCLYRLRKSENPRPQEANLAPANVSRSNIAQQSQVSNFSVMIQDELAQYRTSNERTVSDMERSSMEVSKENVVYPTPGCFYDESFHLSTSNKVPTGDRQLFSETSEA